jgi:hypothetical protein
MQKDVDVNPVPRDSAEVAAYPPGSGGLNRGAYKRRILVGGFSILALSFLVGIFLSFYEWDRGSPFNLSDWSEFNPVGRATYGPLGFALILFPITFPVLLVLSLPIYVGMRRARLWPLSLLGFLGIGLLWLWYITELWKMD